MKRLIVTLLMAALFVPQLVEAKGGFSSSRSFSSSSSRSSGFSSRSAPKTTKTKPAAVVSDNELTAVDFFLFVFIIVLAIMTVTLFIIAIQD